MADKPCAGARGVKKGPKSDGKRSPAGQQHSLNDKPPPSRFSNSPQEQVEEWMRRLPFPGPGSSSLRAAAAESPLFSSFWVAFKRLSSAPRPSHDVMHIQHTHTHQGMEERGNEAAGTRLTWDENTGERVEVRVSLRRVEAGLAGGGPELGARKNQSPAEPLKFGGGLTRGTEGWTKHNRLQQANGARPGFLQCERTLGDCQEEGEKKTTWRLSRVVRSTGRQSSSTRLSSVLPKPTSRELGRQRT
ncbi:hypothetical protein B0J18DRAFT_306531 [Chaetomium sp. MPI-SDFR-AT-0129]|nr:hypothetical protein B0J18DRAFT_306531 [Chaetomium sp. MPI-SDFR-AT-0129]